MTPPDEVAGLRERAKELACLYRVHALLADPAASPRSTLQQLAAELPAGWRWPERTGAAIRYLGRCFASPGYDRDGEVSRSALEVGGATVGALELTLSGEPPTGSPWLPEERYLQRTIAARIVEYLEQKHAEMIGAREPAGGLHWRWRQQVAEALAAQLEMTRFGVEAIYLGGSTASGRAGPASDIDLYLLGQPPAALRAELDAWLRGWSQALAAVAASQTGASFPDGLLNVSWLAAPAGPHQPDLRQLR